MFKSDTRFENYVYFFKGPTEPSLAWHGAEMIFLKIYYKKKEDVGENMEWSDTLSKQMINAWHNYSELRPNDKFTFFNPATNSPFEWCPYTDETQEVCWYLIIQ